MRVARRRLPVDLGCEWGHGPLIDPSYLAWTVRTPFGESFRFIEQLVGLGAAVTSIDPHVEDRTSFAGAPPRAV